METQKKERKPVERRKIGYQVQIEHTLTEARGWANDGVPHDKLTLAIKCGTSRCEEGERFQVVRVVFGPKVKKIKTATKVVLE